jgi:hypothetical protein
MSATGTLPARLKRAVEAEIQGREIHAMWVSDRRLHKRASPGFVTYVIIGFFIVWLSIWGFGWYMIDWRGKLLFSPILLFSISVAGSAVFRYVFPDEIAHVLLADRLVTVQMPWMSSHVSSTWLGRIVHVEAPAAGSTADLVMTVGYPKATGGRSHQETRTFSAVPDIARIRDLIVSLRDGPRGRAA